MLYDRTKTLVGYYIQHRQEPIDRHLLSPSGLGLLQPSTFILPLLLQAKWLLFLPKKTELHYDLAASK